MCWIEGLFIDKDLLKGTKGGQITRYGVGPRNGNVGENLVHQNYYQWVIPILLLQAFLLYMPRVLWRILEDNLMYKLLDGIGKMIPNP